MKERMKRIAALLFVLVATAAVAQQGLEGVLNRMDQTSASFKSAEADFVWDQYQKVVNDTDTQKGKVYFRRQGKDLQMAADITEPDKKYVLYSNDVVRMYQPKIDQVTEYAAGKNKADFESFLVIGFGGRGHDLLMSFDVKYDGSEQVQGSNADKLELTPKTQKARNIFDKIYLWIDQRGLSVQQKFIEPSGDYRLAKYSNIKLNEKVPDDAFKLKTTSRTKVVNPSS